MRRALPLLLGLVVLAGCGGSKAIPVVQGSGPAAQRTGVYAAATAVIRGWSEALRHGRVAAAAGYFELPTVVENGTPPISLRSRAQVELFNKALPCGAKYVRSTRHHGYIIAEFLLTNRTGPGAVRPCTGKGNKADVAFRIAGGKIAEWRRTPAYPGEAKPAPPTGTNAA